MKGKYGCKRKERPEGSGEKVKEYITLGNEEIH
jgi:hypothetical protein